MSNLRVGSPDCKIADIIEVISTCSTKVVLLTEWKTIAISMGLDSAKKKQIHKRQLLESLETTEEIYEEVLNAWVAQHNESGTLDALLSAFEKQNKNEIAALLRDRFYMVKNPPAENQLSLNEKNSNEDLLAEISLEEVDFIKNVKPFEVQLVYPKTKTGRKDHYKLPKRANGLALIINITIFVPDERKYANRDGAGNDTKYMTDLWKSVGYHPTVHEGWLVAEEMDTLIDKFIEDIKEEEDELKSIVVFTGSHGEHGTIEMSSGKPINVYKDLVYKLGKLEVLKGKPKLFMVNACQSFPRTQSDGEAVLKDTMVCFSTLPGDKSKRDIYMGSWYVNCLTRVIMNNAHHLDLEKMLIVTQKTMEKIIAEDSELQMPYHQNFGMEPLYFNLPPA